MNEEHEMIAKVYAAKEDSGAADVLLRQYLPFIRSETAKFIRRPVEGAEDELSVAMFAFHEAVLRYQKLRGSFLRFASACIKSRLTDYLRKEQRHMGQVSLDAETGGEEDDDRTLLDRLESGGDEAEQVDSRTAARQEIGEFAQKLSGFGLSLSDIAGSCPQQERTLAACHRALSYAKEHPELLRAVEQTGRLPIGALAEGSGVPRKTLERHRDYMVALLLAYTNGYEIIRGHLKQTAPAIRAEKGGLA